MIVLANKHQRTDGTAHNMLQRFNLDIPIVLVSWDGEFEFNEELNRLDKYILFDFMEHGWDAKLEDIFLFGQGCRDKFSNNTEWGKLDEFVSRKPPLLYFKRELPGTLYSGNVLPVEYPAWQPIPDIDAEDRFNHRPIEVFFNWGLSNPARPELHGDIWKEMNRGGYIVCDNFYNISGFLQNESNPHKWVTINTPHYARFQIENILNINGLSKLSVCMFGAGRKCFRHTESPSNSVMILPYDTMAWTFAWKSGVNCIRLDGINSTRILDATKRSDLYEIYKAGVETCRKYYLPNYVRHLENIIRNHQ